jgi:hypothetical protein
MPLKLILMSPDGTVGADGQARHDVLRDLSLFIGRMHAHNVEVALWSRHPSTLSGEPLDAYLTRQSKVSVQHWHCHDNRVWQAGPRRARLAT